MTLHFGANTPTVAGEYAVDRVHWYVDGWAERGYNRSIATVYVKPAQHKSVVPK